MGTRGAFGVVVDDIEKIGYNQYDSYPEGKGVDILSWLRNEIEAGREGTIKTLAKDATLVSDDTQPSEADKEVCRQFGSVSLGVSEQSEDDWYCLTRNTHGDIGAMLDLGYILDRGNFPIDSLFCEWAYIIDFDNRVFEVYKGFQERRHTSGRFADRYEGSPEYYPVKLVASFGFDRLPEESEFVERVYDKIPA